MNLVYPYWAIGELSGASTSERPARAAWRERTEAFDWRVLQSAVLAWWWAALLTGAALVGAGEALVRTTSSSGHLLAAAYLSPAGHGLLIAAAALTVIVAQQIQDGQEGTWRDLRLKVAAERDAPERP